MGHLPISPQPSYLMETLPQESIASGHGFAGRAGWRAGTAGGLSARCQQETDPGMMHPAQSSLLEHWLSVTPHAPLALCPGHSQPPSLPVSSAPVVFWQGELISSSMYEWSSCFPRQSFQQQPE